MKLKHFIALCLCMLTLVIFVGCKDKPKTKAITMDRYFNSQVSSKYGNNASASETLKLSSFISESADTSTLKNRASITFEGETSWIYGMYIECIYISFYANKDIRLEQLKYTITDLDSGEYDSTLPEGTFKLQDYLTGYVSKNKGLEFKIPVNKTAKNSQLSITFTLEDNGIDSDFMWTLYNFKVYGETR